MFVKRLLINGTSQTLDLAELLEPLLFDSHFMAIAKIPEKEKNLFKRYEIYTGCAWFTTCIHWQCIETDVLRMITSMNLRNF